MIELTLSTGRTITCIGLAAQHRAVLNAILHRHETPQPSPLSSTALRAPTPGQSDQPGTQRYNMDETG